MGQGLGAGATWTRAGGGAPRLLGRYHVLDEIGRNVVGPLYLARLEGPRGFQRWAAIRRVDKRHLGEDGYVQRFYERVRAGAKLLHPNVTALFDVDEEDGSPWVAMEYLHGERLEEAIARLELADTPASWEIASRIISDAAEGLHAVHSLRDKEGSPLGLLHGDLAPHSLTVTFEGKTKIKGAFEPRVHGVLDPRKVPYAAPEQIFDGVVDARADVFALGVLLWELLAGKRLFARDTDDETRAMIEAGVVPPLAQLVDEVPRELDVLVRRALARDPAARFPSARELSRELESLLVSKGVVARDDDVGRYLRTLFADRFVEQEAALQAAAEVTEVFRRSQQSLGARLAALPNLAPKDAEVEETEMMMTPASSDDDHTTAERPAARRLSGYTDEVPADSGPTIPRNAKPVAPIAPILGDTDEVPTVTAPQSPLVMNVPPERSTSNDELTLTAARVEPPVKTAMKSGGVSTSRLIMPSSLDSDPDVTESAIFVAPRIPATSAEMDRSPPPIPPPRPMSPSFPDRPLLPATPPAGVDAMPRSAPRTTHVAPSTPPPAFAQAFSPPPAFAPPSAFSPPQTYSGAPFQPPPAFPNAQPPSRGPHRAMSTESLRAVLFPQDRTRRVATVSIVGFIGGAVLFLAFFIVWRISVSGAATPATSAAPSVSPAPSAVGSAPPTTELDTTATAATAAAPTITIHHVLAPIPTMDLSQPSPHHHHHGAVAPPPSHTSAPAPTHEQTATGVGKTGYLTVMCKPDACDHVIDAGHDLGGTPLFRQEMSAGKHVLTLRVDTSHAQKIVTVDVPEGSTVAIHPDVEP
jgi:serine/threonine-protein kinase